MQIQKLIRTILKTNHFTGNFKKESLYKIANFPDNFIYASLYFI